MKKPIAAIAVFCLLSCCFLILCACKDVSRYEAEVSQLRFACFNGESETYSVTAYSERREYPLLSDGYAGEKSNFVVLKIQFKNSQKSLINDLSADFYVDKAYNVKLVYKPENECYVANVAVSELPSEDFTLTLTVGSESENVPLKKFLNASLTPTKVLSAATSAKKELFEKLDAENADYEIMIRLMIENEQAFYYVGIVETEYTTALLFDDGGKLLAEKRLKNV